MEYVTKFPALIENMMTPTDKPLSLGGSFRPTFMAFVLVDPFGEARLVQKTDFPWGWWCGDPDVETPLSRNVQDMIDM